MRRHGSRGSIVRSVLLLAVLGLAGCGDSSGGGGTKSTASQVAELLGFKSAEGTLLAPVSLGDVATSGTVSHEGSVANGGTAGVSDTEDSYYVVQGVVPGVTYTVTLGNLSGDADVYVYQADPTFKLSTPVTGVATGTTTESFTVTTDTNVSSYFIAVDGSKTDKGATYTLSVLVRPVSEGGPGGAGNPAPLNLYTAPVQRAGSTVGYDPACDDATLRLCGPTAKDSFYTISLPASPSGPVSYLISLSGLTDDADLYVFKDDGNVSGELDLTAGAVDQANQTLLCSSTKGEQDIETCTVSVPGPGAMRIFVVVDGGYASAGAS